MKNTYFLFVVIFLHCVKAHAEADPIRVFVPAHTEWCVHSQPIDITKEADPRFGDTVFQLLYEKLEAAALAADLESIGIPYLAVAQDVSAVLPSPEVKTKSDSAAMTASPVMQQNTPPLTKIFIVCAVVPPNSSMLAQSVTAREVPKREVYAVRCEARNDADCRKRILAKMHQEGIDTAKFDDDSWTMRQAVSDVDDAQSLANDLIDFRLRPLQARVVLSPPTEMVTVAGNIP